MKPPSPNRNLLTGLIAIFWLLVVTVAYMVTHKPFTPEELLGLLTLAWRMALPTALMILAGGLGMLARPQALALPPIATAALAASLGLGAISLYTLAWGTLIGVNASLFLLPLLTVILLRRHIAAWLALWKNATRERLPGLIRILPVSITILAVCQLIFSLAPPLNFDALTYHYAIPQAYIAQGNIHYIPSLMFWGMPQLTEMLFTLLMLAGGVQAAAVLGWLIGLLALAGVWDLSRAHFGAPSAWLAAAGLLAGETLIRSLGSGYVEWVTILYGWGMLAALTAWTEKKQPAALITAGACAGLALSSKYTAGVGLIGGAVAVALFSGSWRGLLRNGLLFGGAALLVFAPWLLKNLLATGSPVYPLIVPTADFDSTRMAFYNFAPRTQDWSRLVLLPWLATVLGVEKKVGYSASIGPILLGFSPFAWLAWRQAAQPTQRRIIALATLILFSGFLVWAVGSQVRGLLIQTRLYMVIFPAWAVLAAAGFAAIGTIASSQVRFGNVATALAALALIFAAYGTLNRTINADAAGAALGLRDQSSYLERNLGVYAYAIETMRALPPDARVLMLWETRGYYCEPRCDSDEIIDRWFHDWRTTGNIESVLADWRAQGYTHLLLRTDGMQFVRTEDKDAPFTPADWAALDALVSQLTIEQQIDGAYTLYRLSP